MKSGFRQGGFDDQVYWPRSDAGRDGCVIARIFTSAGKREYRGGQGYFPQVYLLRLPRISGQNGPGARLVPMRMTQAGFVNYVRSPRTRQMPSYSTKVLSDAQLGDVYAYIKTLPASRAAKDIPELNQFKEQ